MKIPTAPYRVDCLNQLKRRFALLDPAAVTRLETHLPSAGIAALQKASTPVSHATGESALRDRLWNPAF